MKPSSSLTRCCIRCIRGKRIASDVTGRFASVRAETPLNLKSGLFSIIALPTYRPVESMLDVMMALFGSINTTDFAVPCRGVAFLLFVDDSNKVDLLAVGEAETAIRGMIAALMAGNDSSMTKLFGRDCTMKRGLAVAHRCDFPFIDQGLDASSIIDM